MRHFRVAVLVVVAVGMALCSCTSDEYSVVIRGITPPDTGCVFGVATASDVFQSVGYLDVSFANANYVLGAQVYNYMVASTPNTSMMTMSAMGTLHLNADDILARYAYVRLRKPYDTGIAEDFKGPYEYRIEITGDPIPAAASSDAPGSGVIPFIAIPNGIVQKMIDGEPAMPVDKSTELHLTMDMYLQFDTSSGNTVYSSTWSYAMVICNGCLNGFAGGDPSTCTPDVGSREGNACSPSQDEWSYCKPKSST